MTRKGANVHSKFMRPMKISAELAVIVGKGPLPRTKVNKKLWAYIKTHRRQDPNNRRNILPDEKLSRVFGGKRAVNMFRMSQLISLHLS